MHDPPRQPRLLDPLRWALYGAGVGLVAPLGLWLMVYFLAPQSPREAIGLAYWYTGIVTTVLVGAFGNLAGRMMARLRDASTHDPLTGLSNRRALMSQLPGLFANHSRKAEAICIMMLDLDHFKRVNDRFGHAVGDQTLVAMAGVVLGNVRLGDLVARYGGEEFVVVCPETDAAAGRIIAERIRESVASLQPEDLGFAGAQTISIGLACSTSPGDDPVEVLKRADAALYEAKAGGRNCVRLSPNALRSMEKSVA